ncbi:CBO0543 family protein [Peribacillus frigoritolerans]|uniref:CBO0543 family protein n=1 Tax=Peribacillus frigoritolerans TaxID=450367 RepID=UPI0039A1F95F
MLFHIIVGFILPWVLGVYLFRNQTRLLIIFFPIGVAVATLINDIGFNYFWEMDKNFKDLSLPSIPYNLGLYPILCCLFICSIHYKKMSTLITFLVFTLGTSFLESLIVLLGKLEYRNEWNIYWSSVSYLMAYLILYGYYKLVRKLIIFK